MKSGQHRDDGTGHSDTLPPAVRLDVPEHSAAAASSAAEWHVSADRWPWRSTLIATKLVVPPAPRHVVSRLRLHRLLDAGIEGKVVHVVAPAGFGKSVLVADWLSSTTGRPVGWVSLERSDNDRSRFWAYVLAALATSGVSLPPDVDDLVQRVGTAPPEQAMAPLVNALAELHTEFVLVLDDFHLITDGGIHHELAYLVDRQPPRLHLVIITRSDPPFLSARMKASGEVIDVRARDLAFNQDETILFLGSQRVILPVDLHEALFTRVKGWAAALRLVAIWVSGREDSATAIAEFATSDLTIADYVTGEVLGQLPAESRRFLLWTSVLPRLTGALCDELTGAAGGTQMLDELERREMFVQAIDQSRTWFRYHPLFAELLGQELRRAYPQMVVELHRRASRWFAAHGLVVEAIDHGLVAEDWAGVQALVLDEALSIGTRFHPSMIEQWLSSIPAGVVESSPILGMLQGFAFGHLGRTDDAETVLLRAQTTIGAPTESPESAIVGAYVSACRAIVARLRCDLAEVRRHCEVVERALDGVGGDQAGTALMARAAAANALAGTLFWHGDVRDAELLDAGHDHAGHDMARMQVNATSLTALLLATTGRLRQADRCAARALELARPIGVSTYFQTNPALLACAIVSLQRAEPDRAASQLATLAERSEHHGDRAPRLAAGVYLARLAALGGDVGGAFAILDEAKAVWPGWEPPAALRAMIAEEEARICLLGGDPAAARAIHRYIEALPDEAPTVAWARQMTEARLLLAGGHGGESAALFGLVAQAAVAHQQLALAIEAFVGAAAAARSAGEDAGALVCLDRALELAEPETIITPFVWEATPVRSLLLTMERGDYTRRGFRARLLATLGVPTTFHSTDSPRGGRGEALSDREHAVLRLLRGSLTNTEVAGTLAVSPNTLKTHVRHIYRKLGVDNRKDAVARANELDRR